MSWVLVACGGGFVLMGVIGLIAPHVSERSRRRAAVMGAPAWGPVLPMLAGAMFIAAGLTANGWVLLAAVVVFWLGAVQAKRAMGRMDDPPPMVVRQRERSLNPLDALLHPVRSTKETAEIFKVRRNQAEQRDWEERKGIRPPRGS